MRLVENLGQIPVIVVLPHVSGLLQGNPRTLTPVLQRGWVGIGREQRAEWRRPELLHDDLDGGQDSKLWNGSQSSSGVRSKNPGSGRAKSTTSRRPPPERSRSCWAPPRVEREGNGVTDSRGPKLAHA